VIRDELAQALGEEVAGLEPVAGGSLNAAYRATLAGGARVFVKTADDAAPGAYAAEAAGLRWLAEAQRDGGPPVPEVLAVDADRWIAVAWVDGGGRLDGPALGRGLAALHRAGAPRAGALPPGRDAYVLGPLALPNDETDDWPAFYAASRLLPLTRMAADRGALDTAGVRAVEAVCERIADLAGPPEPAARLHGDLWGGNVHTGADGRPWLIDPAAYGGHREVDLAMLSLFGSQPPSFGAAYDEVWPRAAGHEDRVALYQLLPLLVHAVLFGGGYGASARRAAERYV
jgi:fructosamine-3-kinase